MGKNIFCIGETVFDIIFKDFIPLAAKPGGSMLNSAVSMGRLNLPVYFISEYGTDIIGQFIESFLKNNNVDTTYVYQYSQGKTSVALALLNNQNDAQYSFYKQLPDKRLDISFPSIVENDYVLYGSFYSINKEIRDILFSFVKYAHSVGATLIYDPNFRTSHLHELSELLPFIEENMKVATIVRASDEDFKLIYNVDNENEAYDIVKDKCENLIYTKSNVGAYFITPKQKVFSSAHKISPVSTIGAGDTFNAGLIYSLWINNLTLKSFKKIESDTLKNIISTAIDFATDVCLSYDNYISNQFANKNRIK